MICLRSTITAICRASILVAAALAAGPPPPAEAAEILSVEGPSQDPARPALAPLGAIIYGGVRVLNDYSWAPASADPFPTILGAGGAPVDLQDPARACVAVPGGTNISGLATDHLCVSMDGFLTPFLEDATNPVFRGAGGCTAPRTLAEVGASGPVYSFSIAAAFGCYAAAPDVCGAESGVWVAQPGSGSMIVEWHAVADTATGACRTFQISLAGKRTAFLYDPASWSDGATPVAGILSNDPALLSEPVPGAGLLPSEFSLGPDSALATSEAAVVHIGLYHGLVAAADLHDTDFSSLTDSQWPFYRVAWATSGLGAGSYTLRFNLDPGCSVAGPGCQAAYVTLAPACSSGAECDDGNPCTVDACASAGVCAHTPLSCDDGLACTIDTCEPSSGGCLHPPDPARCTDGLWCNGTETCDPASPVADQDGCAPGPAPCGGGLGCQVVTCEEPASGATAGQCLMTPDDNKCPDDGLLCNGVASCNLDSGSCEPGSVPDCSGLQCPAGEAPVCSEQAGGCVCQPGQGSGDQNHNGIPDVIDGLCPCGTAGRHGSYVSCVAAAVKDLRRTGLLTGEEGGRVVSTASRSGCLMEKPPR